jgi:ribonuclease D
MAKDANTTIWRIISDSLLEAIARERPCDTESLLAIKGIGKIQQQKYGDTWIEVISLFMAANGLEQPAKPQSTTNASTSEPEPAKDITAAQNAVQRVGSKASSVVRTTPQAPEKQPRQRLQRQVSPDSSPPAFHTPPPRSPTLHTGISFTLSETNLSATTKEPRDASPSSSSSSSSLPSLTLYTPAHDPIPDRCTSSGTKRKRTTSPTKQTNDTPEKILHALPAELRDQELAHAMDIAPSRHVPPQGKTMTSPPQTTAKPSAPSKADTIARNKLLAFSKLVTSKMPRRDKDAAPIVSLHTLDLIVAARPRTKEELEHIPGVEGLVRACKETGMELMRNVGKFLGPGEWWKGMNEIR